MKRPPRLSECSQLAACLTLAHSCPETPPSSSHVLARFHRLSRARHHGEVRAAGRQPFVQARYALCYRLSYRVVNFHEKHKPQSPL